MSTGGCDREGVLPSTFKIIRCLSCAVVTSTWWRAIAFFVYSLQPRALIVSAIYRLRSMMIRRWSFYYGEPLSGWKNCLGFFLKNPECPTLMATHYSRIVRRYLDIGEKNSYRDRNGVSPLIDDASKRQIDIRPPGGRGSGLQDFLLGVLGQSLGGYIWHIGSKSHRIPTDSDGSKDKLFLLSSSRSFHFHFVQLLRSREPTDKNNVSDDKSELRIDQASVREYNSHLSYDMH